MFDDVRENVFFYICLQVFVVERKPLKRHHNELYFSPISILFVLFSRYCLKNICFQVLARYCQKNIFKVFVEVLSKGFVFKHASNKAAVGHPTMTTSTITTREKRGS